MSRSRSEIGRDRVSSGKDRGATFALQNSKPAAGQRPKRARTKTSSPSPSGRVANHRATLEDAIELALRVHRGKTDKAGAPYILHVLRVMVAMEDDTARMAAVLHDVVEDSDCTLADLRAQGFPRKVVAAVDALTRRPGESYEAFVLRAAANPIARRVKLADLEDNMDVRRLNALEQADLERLRRYRRAWEILHSVCAGRTNRRR